MNSYDALVARTIYAFYKENLTTVTFRLLNVTALKLYNDLIEHQQLPQGICCGVRLQLQNSHNFRPRGLGYSIVNLATACNNKSINASYYSLYATENLVSWIMKKHIESNDYRLN